MAYWINDVGNNNRPNLKEFYCDLSHLRRCVKFFL